MEDNASFKQMFKEKLQTQTSDCKTFGIVVPEGGWENESDGGAGDFGSDGISLCVCYGKDMAIQRFQ